MIASVQYNDLIGTAAADIADGYMNSLQKYLMDTYEKYNSERYVCRGCTIYIGGQRNCPTVSLNFLCWDSKHSIASVDISMKSNTFALQNIKQRIWQAVKILKGYWNFTTRSQRQVEYQLFLSVKRMVSFTLSLRGGTRTVIR